jgi:hypothetical protein
VAIHASDVVMMTECIAFRYVIVTVELIMKAGNIDYVLFDFKLILVSNSFSSLYLYSLIVADDYLLVLMLNIYNKHISV